MLQYLPLSEQHLDIHLVSCIIKKIPIKAQDVNLGLVSVTQSFLCHFRTRWLICFLPGWRKEVFLCKQFLFLVAVARNAFNGSLHGHFKNLVKIFHHDINIHKTFSCLLFHISNTVIHSIAFAQNTFFYQANTGQLPFFLLSALSYCSAQWVVENS